MIDRALLQKLKRRPKVRRASELFNSSRLKCSLTYFQILEQLLDPDNRLTDIARTAGVLRSRMCQIYDKHFKSLLGARTPRERLKERTRARTVEQSRAFQQSDPPNPKLRVVAARARKAGLSVALVPIILNGDKAQAYTHVIFLADKRCRVHSTSRIQKNPRVIQEYAHVSFAARQLSEYEFTIVDVDCNPSRARSRIFVLPNSVLAEMVSKKKYCNLYIPLLKRPRRNKCQRPDLSKYENAWHLLTQPAAPP